MEEMKIGARKINETGATLSEISHNLEDSIVAIDNEINEFKV
jgi:methyl-accepting chemotaxis protein